MVVHDFQIPHRAFAPLEAYPPLVIDTDAVLATPVAVQSFEPIARRNAPILKLLCRTAAEDANLVSRQLRKLAAQPARSRMTGCPLFWTCDRLTHLPDCTAAAARSNTINRFFIKNGNGEAATRLTSEALKVR